MLYQSEIFTVLHGSVLLSPTSSELHQEMNHIHLQPIAMSLVRFKGQDELNILSNLVQ